MHPEDFKLSAYAWGELELADRLTLAEHLRNCEACRLVVEDAQAFGRVLVGELEKEPCPEPAIWPRNVFYERVTLANIWRPSRWRWVEVSLVSAAGLVLAIGLSGLVWQSRRDLQSKYAANLSRINSVFTPLFDTAQERGQPNGYFRYEPNEAAPDTVAVESKVFKEFQQAASATGGKSSEKPTTYGQVNAAGNSADYRVNKPQYETKTHEPVPTANLPQPQWMSDNVQSFPKGTEFKIDALGRRPVVLGRSGLGTSPADDAGGDGQQVADRDQWQQLTKFRSGLPHFDFQNPRDAVGEAGPNTEAYDQIIDNKFREVHTYPLSTFSIDVDTASYSNLRRFLTSGNWPPKDAVRIEEMLNYFSYDYAPPQDDKPFATHVEVTQCPWNLEHRLVRVALKGREISHENRPVSNLVFLLDVSGSMQPANKLPLVKQAMQLLVQKLGENDRVAIVVYAGASGLVLPSTTCDQKKSILASLDRLQSGGSTAGSAGIELAYHVAQTNFIKGGTNRVILCTDGDFNVGITDPESLKSLIKQKSADGVFLSVLGCGMGNLQDNRLEMLADNGNGNYAYIDNAQEAKKVLVDQLSGTLVTIAKDVKIQIEFNPAQVAGYRLIGYENRVLKAEDFKNDRVDAGDIGAGHTVTALYEIVPARQVMGVPAVDPLKYQKPARPVAAGVGDESGESLTLKLRYKEPDGQTSRELEYPITDSNRPFVESSKDLRFAAAVAEFGMLLRNSPYKGSATLDSVLELAHEGLGADAKGYRAEFISLVGLAKQLRP